MFQRRTMKIVHIIKIDQLYETIDKTAWHTEQDLKTNNFYHTLDHEIKQAQPALKTVPTKTEMLVPLTLLDQYGNL